MTNSTANQTSHSKLLANSEDCHKDTSGTHCDDISEKQFQGEVLFLLAATYFGVILGCFSLLLVFVNSDSVIGVFCGVSAAIFLVPAFIYARVVKFKKAQ